MAGVPSQSSTAVAPWEGGGIELSPSRPTGVGPEGVFELFPFVTQLRERDVIACPPRGLLWEGDGGVSSMARSGSWWQGQLTHTAQVSKEPSRPCSRRAHGTCG